MLTTRRSRLVVGIVLGMTFFLLSTASGEIPKRINYQGRLTDAETDQPLTGSHGMIFRIFEMPVGGTEIWSESAMVPFDSAGVFSVILGAVNAMDMSFDAPVWLEVEVEGEVLVPRREIVSVPFAFHAMDCDSLGGVSSDSYWTAVNDGAGSGLDADMLDGLSSEAFADTGHTHDHRYVHRDSLGSVGTLNNGSNPVDWTRLKGVPGDFADGVDDAGGAGDGHSLDAADGDPVDAVYVDDEGYVGVGTPSPTERLHLSGPTSRILVEAGTSDPEIGLAGLFYPPSDIWRIYVNKGLGTLCFARGGDRMTITSGDGNVAIGASFAGERLHVEGNINLTDHLKIGGTTVLSVDGTANTFLGRDTGLNNSGSSNTFVGEAAGYLNGLGFDNVFVGDSTGLSNTQGFYNVFVGHTAGYSNTTGQDNTFIGARAGRYNEDGNWNTFVGSGAGLWHGDGWDNTFVGAGAGSQNYGGTGNTCLGFAAGGSSGNRSTNTCLGAFAGPDGDGDGNVIIGYMAGLGRTLSDKLLIANGPESTDVLVYGDFSTGNVGLGTLDPDRRLHIASPTSNFGMLMLENSNTGDNEASIGFKPGSDATGADMWVAGVGAWDETGDFVIGQQKPLMVLTPNGRLGIGETFPTNMIEAEAPSLCWITATAVGGYNTAGFGVTNDDASWDMSLRGTLGNSLAIRYVTASSEFLVINTEGDVGLGTVSPERKLHVKGPNPRILIEATSAAPEVNFKHTGDAISDVWAIYKEGTSEDLRFYQGVDKIWIKGGTGNVGIGHDPESSKLYVNGSGCYTGSWVGCSDLKFKRDIQGVTDAVDKVMSLRGVSFLWRSDEYEAKNFDSGRHYGVVAQEIERVLPEVVAEGADGEKAVAYTEIVPVLIEAIKAQQEHIEALEQRIAGLEAGASAR